MTFGDYGLVDLIETRLIPIDIVVAVSRSIWIRSIPIALKCTASIA